MPLSNKIATDQQQAPLLEAMRDYLQVDHAPFYMPGHKRGQGIDREFSALVGKNLFRLDLPELPGIDGAIAAAESLAAEAYGASHTWFLVNGSTCGIGAMMLAVCATGKKILLGRNCHKAAISALILCGAVPIYLETAYNSQFELDLGVTPATLEIALTEHADATAVMVVSPNYYGVCGEIEELVAICHARNVPVLVDAAHGAHLGFHPDLPISAVSAGADLVVQSTHKVTSGMTQASMLHLRSNLIGVNRVSQALQLLQSTSPNLLLLTSLDVARRQMAVRGKELLTNTLALADRARSQIAGIPALSTFDVTQIPTLDPTRLTVMVDRLGLTGYEVDTTFYERLGVMAEMPTLRQLVFILSFGNTDSDIERLVAAFTELEREQSLSAEKGKRKKEKGKRTHPLPLPTQKLTPREAFFSKINRIPFAQASGRVSTETICPYPPGIPVICPGEVITAEVIAYIQLIHRSGGAIDGCDDKTLKTIRVVA